MLTIFALAHPAAVLAVVVRLLRVYAELAGRGLALGHVYSMLVFFCGIQTRTCQVER
jgi:hypothetical protein